MSLESLFSGVSPQSTLGGDPPGRDNVLNLALAAKGMKPDAWHSLLWRHLRDDRSWQYLGHRLVILARQSRSPAVRDRAHLLARLALAEEHGRLDDLEASGIEHVLMDCTRRDWREKLRPQFLQLRAQLDRWCRSGAGLIARRTHD